MCSNAPVLLQIHRQVGGNDLATTVAHEACGIELSHESVNYRHSSSTCLPLVDVLGIKLPGRVTRLNTTRPEDCGLMSLTVVSEEITDPQFKVHVCS